MDAHLFTAINVIAKLWEWTFNRRISEYER